MLTPTLFFPHFSSMLRLLLLSIVLNVSYCLMFISYAALPVVVTALSFFFGCMLYHSVHSLVSVATAEFTLQPIEVGRLFVNSPFDNAFLSILPLPY